MEQNNTPDSINRLFEGDKGRLSLDARKSINLLFKGPVLKSQNIEAWTAIINHKTSVESFAHDASVELVVSYTKEEAYFSQIEDPHYELDPLKKVRLSYYDSVLWTHLCTIYIAADSRGEVTFVEEEDLIAHLNRFENITNQDELKQLKAIKTAILKAVSHKVLSPFQSALGNIRYRINSILVTLLNADRAELLRANLVKFAQTEESNHE